MDQPRLTRDSPFSYICNRCMSCCRDNHISLDPYEIARLARNRNLSTTEFIGRFLVEGGFVISSQEDRACAFLGNGSCEVYQDRPMVCRTYPLRRAAKSGREEFLKLIPHPQTKGKYGENGTAGDFLNAHDIDAFVAADDKYFALTNHIIEALGKIIRSAPKLFRPIRETMTSYYELHAHDAVEMIDVDRIVGDYCRDRGLALPASLDGLITLHIEAIEQRLVALLEAVSNRDVDAKQHEILQMAALAGALGVATAAHIKSMLAAAVLGKPPVPVTNVADNKRVANRKDA
jgi:Fe-S-cluster containining protein